jgi:hypothetical protein
LLKSTVPWNALTALSIIDAFKEFVPCSFSLNRRFGEHIAFRIPWLITFYGSVAVESLSKTSVPTRAILFIDPEGVHDYN